MDGVGPTEGLGDVYLGSRWKGDDIARRDLDRVAIAGKNDGTN